MVLASPGRLARPLARFCFICLAVAAPFARAAEGGTLSLAEALKIGEKISPRLAAQSAVLAAARELVPRAGELPDPKLRIGVENLPVNGADRFRYDVDPGTMRRIGIVQDFPNGEKRKLRGERAARERDVEVSNLAAQRSGEKDSAMLSQHPAALAQRRAAKTEQRS